MTDLDELIPDTDVDSMRHGVEGAVAGRRRRRQVTTGLAAGGAALLLGAGAVVGILGTLPPQPRAVTAEGTSASEPPEPDTAPVPGPASPVDSAPEPTSPSGSSASGGSTTGSKALACAGPLFRGDHGRIGQPDCTDMYGDIRT